MKVGDIVKIKENYEFFVNSMKEYRGKQAKITRVSGESYKLDIDDGRWNWTDSMFEPKEEIKMKFNVGDTVKIKEGLKEETTSNFVEEMEKYCGKIAKITRDVDDEEWYWKDDMPEPIQQKTYSVTVEGNTVTVKDDKGNTGIAKCSPEDEFNLSTAISTAISRLKWKPSFGEKYYSINFADKNPVSWYTWSNDYIDNTFYERGLIFRTEEEAEEVAKIMLDSIREK